MRFRHMTMFIFLVLGLIVGGCSGSHDDDDVDHGWVFDKHWEGETMISEGHYAQDPRAVIDDAGNAIAVFLDYDPHPTTELSIFANRYEAGIGWGEEVQIDFIDGGGSQPRIAMDGQGNALAVWEKGRPEPDSTIWGCWYRVGIGWSEAEKISFDVEEPYAQRADVGMDDAGNAMVVWRQSDGDAWGIFARRHLVDQSWTEPELLGTESASTIRIEMNGVGTAAVCWNNPMSGTRDLFIRIFQPDQGWSPIETIGATFYGYFDMTITDQGNVMVVWGTITARFYQPQYGWGTPYTVASYHAGFPKLASNNNGESYVTWYYSEHDGAEIWLAHFTDTAGWQEPEIIFDHGNLGIGPSDIGVDDRGVAIPIWFNSDPTGERYLWSKFFLPGRGWSFPRTIGNYEDTTYRYPVITVSRQGNAIAIWSDGDIRANILR